MPNENISKWSPDWVASYPVIMASLIRQQKFTTFAQEPERGGKPAITKQSRYRHTSTG